MLITIPRRLQIEAPLAALLRQAPPGDVIEWDHETWVSHNPIGIHTDATKPGLVTYGVVLVNDPRFLLAYGDEVHDAPPGTVFRLDGRRPHGALAYTWSHGCFAFLAWDMPDHGMTNFIREVVPALHRKTAGHKAVA